MPKPAFVAQNQLVPCRIPRFLVQSGHENHSPPPVRAALGGGRPGRPPHGLGRHHENLRWPALGPFRRDTIFRSRWGAAEIAPASPALAIWAGAAATGLAGMGTERSQRHATRAGD